MSHGHTNELDRPADDLLDRPPLPSRLLQIQNLSDLVRRPEDHINILLRVRRGQAEPHPRRHQRRGGVRDDHDDNGDLARAHHPAEHCHLTRVEEEKGDDRRVVGAVSDESKLAQAAVEVARVECDPPEANAALGAVNHAGHEWHPRWQLPGGYGARDDVCDDGGVVGGAKEAKCGRGGLLVWESDAHDTSRASNDLREDGRGHRLAVVARMTVDAKTVNDLLVASNVATSSAERLGERAHEDVDLGDIDTEVFGDTTAMGSKSADRVSLVDEQVELIRAISN